MHAFAQPAPVCIRWRGSAPQGSARGHDAGRRREGAQSSPQIPGAIGDIDALTDGLAPGGQLVKLGQALTDGLDHSGGGGGQLCGFCRQGGIC